MKMTRKTLIKNGRAQLVKIVIPEESSGKRARAMMRNLPDIGPKPP